MRANQPMGLTTAAAAMTQGLVRVDTGVTYEGYWDERFPLSAYVRPTPAIDALLAEQEVLRARLAEVGAQLDTEAARWLAQGQAAFTEYEQATLFSSGPCMFLALRDGAGDPVPPSLWGECQMEVAANGECSCRGELCAPGCREGCRKRRQKE